MTGWKVVPFCIVPLVTTILIWTNNWHHLMWSNERLMTSGAFTITAKDYGPAFWVTLVYNYTLVVGGSVLLARRLFIGISLYAGQAFSLLVAASLPLVWNIIYVFKLLPLPRKDLTPVAFAVSGICIVFGLMRFRLLTLVPFARIFLFQSTADGVMVFDIQKRLLEANPAALELIGAEKNIFGALPDKIRPLAPLADTLFSIKGGTAEISVEVKGEARYYDIMSVAMNESREHSHGWLVVMHDVTERKKVTDALVESEGRFREIAEELKDQNDKKTEFLHHVAHELKTPLTSIISSSELVSTDDSDSIPLSQKNRLMNNINRSAWMMESKIEELIDLADIQIGQVKLNPEPLRLNEVIGTIVGHFASVFQNRQQVLEMEISFDLPPVRADRKKTESILNNLLSNANKFSPAGARILLRAVRQGDMVRVEIHDAAPRIIESERRRMFTSYFRGNSADVQERLPGLGIGLAVTRGLVTLQGGEFDIMPGEGEEGNTFYFTLPVWKDQP